MLAEPLLPPDRVVSLPPLWIMGCVVFMWILEGLLLFIDSAVVEMTEFSHTHTHARMRVYNSFCLSVFSLFEWLKLPFVYALFKCVSTVTRTLSHSGWWWQMSLIYQQKSVTCGIRAPVWGGTLAHAADRTGHFYSLSSQQVHGKFPHCQFYWEMQRARRECQEKLQQETKANAGTHS